MDKTSDNGSGHLFEHTSVLLRETVQGVFTNPNGVYVDCTLGGAGHAALLAEKLTESGRLIGVDQDPSAVQAGRERLAAARCRVDIIRDNFKNLRQILDRLGVAAADGILFDLGVSSHQLDTADRGFSYMKDAGLDMRMDPSEALSAYDVVNTYSQENLSRLIARYGEEKWAKRIAQFIVRARAKEPVATTGQLAEIIKNAVPASARREGPHPAKRTFQALRIEVNDELNILKEAFRDAAEALVSGGRLAIITFHSLEDRITKQTLRELAQGCVCPPQLPVCMCDNKPKMKIISKIIIPSAEELAQNPRARSAKLRLAEKI